ASCASSLLPLLNASPRLFFSDAHPFPASSSPSHNTSLPDKLISAVDLYHRGVPIFSRVIETDTSTSWFRNSAFLIDAPSATGAVSPKDLTLSWIVIDPAKGRAVNLSSRRAVAVEKRDWCVGETVARFATVREGLAVGAVVMWRKGREDVMEVTLMVEDMDGVCVSGLEGLRAVVAAMEGERKGMGEDEAGERYLEYVKMKRSREERRDKRLCFGDICFAAFAVFLSLASVSLYFLR
ncbi:probable F-box protein At2g36090, partial [Phalaenopsis equestris]|uniref:probable F-box protein At2g36090 n=1 Tax=Phalaenopsis equestris TaxID=78828 RepID=UPI0009E4D723